MKGLKVMKEAIGLPHVVFMSFMFFMVQSPSSTQQQRPVFRARTDLVQMDVTVLDKTRQPVRGLMASDFVLLEDNVPQTIEGFTAVDLADTVVEGPVWASRAVADVTSNEINNQRIFVIMLDDALGMPLWAKREMKATATAFVEALGPTDLAAVVFTGTNSRASQNLTSDRARLIKAIAAYPDQDGNLPTTVTVPNQFSGGKGPKKAEGPCLGYRAVLGLFTGIVKNLSSVPDRRKAILYFGTALPWAQDPQIDNCGIYWLWRDVFAAAQQAHVTINPINTGGFTGATPEHYLAVAENTGGRAVFNTNDLQPGVREILVRNSSYYLLAYQPTHAEEDGTFRRISVTVKGRPELEVLARRNYWATKTRKAGDPPPPPPPPEVEALAGILPLSTLALRVTAAPFAVPSSQSAVVTLALGLRQPAFASRTAEQVELLVKAFTADGDERGSDTQLIPITVPAARADNDVTRYEVLARVELPKPGKYEVRLSARSVASDTRGSVFVDVEVPDFRKEKLSLSGVVLNSALPSAPVAPPRLLRDIVPFAPTSERAFGPSDVVTAFLRAYQGGNDKIAPVPIKISIQDAKGKSVFDRTDTLTPDRFGDDRAAEYRFRLPLASLAVGDYLLTCEASLGKITVKRDVRFQLQ